MLVTIHQALYILSFKIQKLRKSFNENNKKATTTKCELTFRYSDQKKIVYQKATQNGIVYNDYYVYKDKLRSRKHT